MTEGYKGLSRDEIKEYIKKFIKYFQEHREILEDPNMEAHLANEFGMDIRNVRLVVTVLETAIEMRNEKKQHAK